MISYAQNFEDVMLERIFKGQSSGFYVDIGAWDPDEISVTKHFYLRGWNGINIEPITKRLNRFKRSRPRDINLAVAISSKEGRITLWLCEEQDYLSTIDPQQALQLSNSGFQLSEFAVPTKRLDEILIAHAVSDIDFMKVDVEGAEADVLSTLDLTRWRPRVLLIEAVKPRAGLSDWSQPECIETQREWEPSLVGSGYDFAYFDGLNRFYIRQEDQSLASRLKLPPCIFDEIENIAVRDDAASIEGQLRSQLELAERDRADRLVVIDGLLQQQSELQGQLEVSEKDRAERVAAIGRLAEEASKNATVIDELQNRLRSAEFCIQQLETFTGFMRHLAKRWFSGK